MIKNTNYQLYIASTIRLAQTIVIKFAEAAKAINDRLVEKHGPSAVNTAYPETWKYYLNLAGVYHPTDTVMTVVSSDTLEEITFSKENLLIHRQTSRDYAFGTRQYRELLARYPEQEMLIKGILNPADIQKAIEADNGTILAWPADLVEPNEYSLINKLQKFVNGFREQHINPQFGLTDSLYYAAIWAVLSANLVPAILTFRREACKTNEAHSFHVRMYLASHHGLDVYMDQLTIKQSLWLYRNIVYIEANFGKQDTFDWLVEHIMTERHLPLGAFTMRHDVSDQPTEIYPAIAFKKTPINAGVNADFRDIFSLDEMLDKEQSFARSNAIIQNDAAPVMRKAMRNSLSSVVATKVLESSVVDRSNNTPWTMDDILLHHWLYFASKGYYTAFVGIEDPVSGERIPLSVKDAYVFLWYAFAKSIGIELVEIPQILATRVQRVPMATVDDIYSVVDKSLIDYDVALEALSVQPQVTPIISTEAFYNKCVEIFNAAQYQRRLISNEEHSLARAMKQNMVSRIYADVLCEVADAGETYTQWFADRNIVISNYTVSDLSQIYVNIVRAATGAGLTTKKSLRDLQAAMIRIMGTLSSYSVQFNAEINSSNIMVTDWTAIRIDDILSKFKSDYYLNDMVAEVKATHGHMKDLTYLDVNEFIMTPVHSGLNDLIKYELPSPFPAGSGKYRGHVRMEGAPIRITPVPALQMNARGVIPVLGTAEWLDLDAADQADMVDIYGSKVGFAPGITIPPAELPPLSEVIPVNVLSGLLYDNTWPPAHIDISQTINDRQLDGFDHT